MLTRFFIDRPIFATVLSIAIALAGAIALFTLPVAQYPPIVPPGVQVSIQYPGASARVVADTVAAPIEQQVNGIDHMLYMSSQSGNDGSYTLTVTFDIGTDTNIALVMVQNRVALAMYQLPTSVQNQGILIRKKTPDILMVVNFFSPHGLHDDVYLSNYATINVKDELLRIYGVSDITYLGRARLQHPRLARSAEVSVAQHDGQRRGQRRSEPEPGRTRRPGRAAAGLPHAILATADRHAGPTDDAGTIRRHHHQDRSGPAAAAGQRYCPVLILILIGQLRAPHSPRRQSAAPTRKCDVARRREQHGIDGRRRSRDGPVGELRLAGPVRYAAGRRRRRRWFQRGNSHFVGGRQCNRPDGGGGSSMGGTMGGAQSGGGASTAGGAQSGGGATTSVTSPASLANLVLTNSTAGVSSTGTPTGGTTGPTAPTASIVRLRDVARVELGAQSYTQACTFDQHPSVGLAIWQLPGTNALDVANRVKAKMEELKERFPFDVDYDVGYDTTPFIRESIEDVVHTLLEAVALVGVVVLLFLQDWRAMILPMIDVPVSIIGTFAVMAVLGFSLNNISLFGLVLAIGIVVDDAIVVLENIERMMARGLDPRTATLKAMDEVTGPIIAVGLVLCVVFVPCAFLSGITGHFFYQFAVTIAVSTMISALNAVTMTPSRAVQIFTRQARHGEGKNTAKEALPWWIFGVPGGLLSVWLARRFLAGLFPGLWAAWSVDLLAAFLPGASSAPWWVGLSSGR